VIKINQFLGYVKVSAEVFGFRPTRELNPTVENMGHLQGMQGQAKIFQNCKKYLKILGASIVKYSILEATNIKRHRQYSSRRRRNGTRSFFHPVTLRKQCSIKIFFVPHTAPVSCLPCFVS
jgi:hypothetical protein